MVGSSSTKYLPVRDSCCYPYVWRCFPARSAGVCWKQGKADKRHLCLAFPVVSITGRAFRVGCLHEGWCNHTQFSASAHRRALARMRKPPLTFTASRTSKNWKCKIRMAFFVSKLAFTVGNVLRLITVIRLLIVLK